MPQSKTERYQDDVVATTREVTPEQAAAILRGNTHNRNLRPDYASSLAREMTERRWKENGEAIVIAKTGRLLDGQHRLHAVIEADVPVRFLVVEGVDEDAFNTIDQGEKRKISDLLVLNGVSQRAVVIVASAKIIVNRKADLPLESRRSAQEILTFVDKNPRIVEHVRQARSIGGTVVPPSAMSAVGFLATENEAYEQAWQDFLQGVGSGANLNMDDPRLALRILAQTAKTGSYGGGFKGPHAFAATATAWNGFIANRPMTRIRIATGERGQPIAPPILGENDWKKS